MERNGSLGLSVRVPGCQNYKWRLNPVWHRIPYSCTHIYGNSGRQRVNETYHIVSWLCRACVGWTKEWARQDKTRDNLHCDRDAVFAVSAFLIVTSVSRTPSTRDRIQPSKQALLYYLAQVAKKYCKSARAKTTDKHPYKQPHFNVYRNL